MATQITFTDTGFPGTTFSGTVQDLVDAFLQYLGGTIPDPGAGSVLVGQIGGSAPVADVGPWLDNRTWKVWNGSAYKPAVLAIGDATNVITFAGSPTAARTQTFQDKTGTVALTSDVFAPRASIDLSAVSHAIDWSTSFSFFETIGANTVFTSANSLPGQSAVVRITASGADRTATFPTSFLWDAAGGASPFTVQSGTTDLFLLKNVGGTIYGQHLDNFA